MVPAARSTLDVALWLVARADSAGEKLQPQKLQRLLYLAQAHYAGSHEGQKLMPAVFLATELGPLEPNIYYLFQSGEPKMVYADPAATVEEFLMGLWDRYGPRPAEDLLTTIAGDGAFALALKAGRNTEVTTEIMSAGYGGKSAVKVRGGAKPSPEPSYWTPTGKRATKWIPGQAPRR
ncbi:MAG: hypothetical protein FJX64_08740 [Alphaproteobacteria bacterium]|nr:hypothetical protein [Alphaproteobacteria bacterium]